MLLRIVKYSLLLGLIVSSSVLCAAKQDLFEILLNVRTKSLKIKLDKNKFVNFWYDSYNGLELDDKIYTRYYEKKNLSIDKYFKFIDIQGGTFNMGSPVEEEGRYDDEDQIPDVKVSNFSMQTTQVTQFQYWLVTKSNPSRFKNKDNCPQEHAIFNGVSMCPNHPVEGVSWDDAQTFIQSLNEKSDDYTYSLPTEAQWEYSARAGTRTRYSFADDVEKLADYAWYRGNSSNQTHQVASLEPNPFGLSDMHGNVWEWAEDDWSRSSERFVEENDPVFKDSSRGRVIRGGGWNNLPRDLRSAVRHYWWSDVRYDGLGLRLVRTPK